MNRKTVLAVDIGAESGRVMAVHFDGARFAVEELHRFSNPFTLVRGTLYWDMLHLWRNIQQGIEKGKMFEPISVAVDTWGVDFALLDAHGGLLANPVMYRDARTNGMMEVVFERVPKREVFAQTGIQFMQINTLYQMMSLVVTKSPLLDAAATFLTTPDLFSYWLTGVKASEFTSATTTQMLNPLTCNWATGMLDRLGIPTHFLPEVLSPGTRLGEYDGMGVILPASHDTGSAVAAVPAQRSNYAYISSGTWSLVGLEMPNASLHDSAFEANLTNEGGVENTWRLLKNVIGLWILQQCRAAWTAAGIEYSYSELMHLAEQAEPLRSVVDVDDPRFLPPGDHPQKIQACCSEHGLPVPQTPGEVVRCVLESLAFKYREVVEHLCTVTGRGVEIIHIVGGGSQNRLLNQFTANATGIPVIAGPVEATVLGNAAVQWIAAGEIENIGQARQIIAAGGDTTVYTPQDREKWDIAHRSLS